MVFETLEVYIGKHGMYSYGFNNTGEAGTYIVKVVDYRTRKQHTAYADSLWEVMDFISKLKNLDERLYG